MKNFVIAVLFSLFAVAQTGCYTVVEPGHAGIRVNMYGSGRGVEDYPIETGRVWYNPFNETVYEFPTFIQQATWANNAQKGIDESVTFNSIEGSPLNVDVGVAYQIEAAKVPHIFVKFRQDADTLTHGYLRTKVRDTLNRHASTMKVTEIFGEGKTRLITEAENDLKEELGPEGFHIDTISFVSKFRVDGQVESAINATITATQRAVEAENKIRQSEAEAKQAEAVANGIAKSILIDAKAKAEANRILSESLTPGLITYESLKKWDGKMPMVIGGDGAMPFINLDKK
jgi:regulator of protease activity HflC (stomatin/prohibitin superfamily)